MRAALVLQGELIVMANPPVETVSTGADKAKLAAVALLVVSAVAVFYVLGTQDLWLRVLALLGLVAVAAVVFFTSEPGKQLIAYGKDSIKEVRKVVWPARLWVTDKTLEWVLYDLLLGWKR